MLIFNSKNQITSFQKIFKTLLIMILIIFENFIISDKTLNLNSNSNKRLCYSNLKNKFDSKYNHIKEYSLTSFLDSNNYKNTDKLKPIVLIEKEKAKINSKMNIKSNLKSELQLELQAMKMYLLNLKDELKNNKDLPAISSLGYEGQETEITTEEFSTSLKLSKEEVGRYTWNVLHSMASAFPLKADEAHQNAIKLFIEKM